MPTELLARLASMYDCRHRLLASDIHDKPELFRWKDACKELATSAALEVAQYTRNGWTFIPHDGDTKYELEKLVEKLWETKDTKPQHFPVNQSDLQSSLWGPVDNYNMRAVHDMVHLALGAGFDLPGEYRVYRAQAVGNNHETRCILFSEIVLQAAYFLHQGKFHASQHVIPFTIAELLELEGEIVQAYDL